MDKYSPDIFRTSLFGEQMAVFCGALGNKFLFSNECKLVKSWVPSSFNAIIFTAASRSQDSTGDKTKRIRGLLSGFLKIDALQKYIPIMDSVARQHIEKEWAPKTEVLVSELSKKYTLQLACQLFFSVKDTKHVARFADQFENIMAGLLSVPINFPGTTFHGAIKDSEFIRKELLIILKQRKMDQLEKKESTAQDLLSHLLLTPDENGNFMDEMDITDQIIAVLLAGYDTASTTITFIVYYLADFPHVYNEVFKEQMEIKNSKGPNELLNLEDINKMKYSWNVACEVMRLAPPAQVGFREALTDFTYAGFTIPKGWKACWCVYSTHNNPKYFPNPEKFDPSRFGGNGPAPYSFIPFGGGPRMCPGKEYARLEILVFMHNLVTKFKWEKSIPNEKKIFRPSPVPANGLPICLQPY